VTADPRLAQAFRTALELSPDVDVETLAYGQHPSWDSVGHMALVAEIEDAFDVRLESDDVLELSSYAKGVELLQRLEDAA
jgi:acyl carrier protein